MTLVLTFLVVSCGKDYALLDGAWEGKKMDGKEVAEDRGGLFIFRDGKFTLYDINKKQEVVSDIPYEVRDSTVFVADPRTGKTEAIFSIESLAEAVLVVKILVGASHGSKVELHRINQVRLRELM